MNSKISLVTFIALLILIVIVIWFFYFRETVYEEETVEQTISLNDSEEAFSLDDLADRESELCFNDKYSTEFYKSDTVWEKDILIRLDENSIQKLKKLIEENGGAIPQGELNGLECLTSLSLSDTSLSSVSALSDLTNLYVLVLRNTEVSDISPLAKLTNLGRLILTGAPVSNVSSLAELNNLTWLDIKDTSVVDVSSLDHLSGLEIIK